MITQKFIPPRSLAVLERERLLGKLASWNEKKVLIIHGPAGQGKSTLAADHLRSLPIPPLWYTLDKEDTDPAVFLSRFGEALHRLFPRQVPKAPSPPRDRYRASDPSPMIAQWLSRLFQDIPSGMLVFDDYHTLADAPAVADILTLLIETTPPGVRILVLSRTRPELPLVRLRSKRGVGELSAADLRFTESEVADLFGSVFGTPLSRTRASHFCRMTGGWAVGLVLLHEYLSAAGHGHDETVPPGPVSGYQDQVFDYLANEVFSQLSHGLQEFLFRTAITDPMPLPLATILTNLPLEAAGRPCITGMLAELAKRNLFLDTNSDARILRYHALFREFLAARFAATVSPSERKRTYRTAAEWFLRNGDPMRAADLFIASEQPEKAAKVLEERGRELIGRGQVRTLLAMIDRIPLALQKRPWFLFARAVACRFTDPRRALTLYDQALSGFQAAQDQEGRMLALGGIIEAAFHSGGDFRRMERAALQAQTVLRRQGRGRSEARATLLFALGTAWFFTGKLPLGIDALRQAMDLFRAAGDHFSLISCAIYLTPCALYHGDFLLARDTVAAGFEAQRSTPDEPGGEAALYLVQAMTQLFAGDFTAAQDSLDAGRRVAAEYRLESIDLLLLDIYGWLKIAQGDYRRAEQLLDECRQREVSAKAFFNLTASHFLAIAALFQRKLDLAKTLSDQALAPGVRSGSRLFHAIYLIIDGAILREQGEFIRAERTLGTAIRMLRQSGAAQQEANGHLVLAGLYLRQNKIKQAHRHLAAGFLIGEERGFTYYAPLAPRELQELAREAAANGICSGYCSLLLDQRRPAAAAPLLRIHCLGGFRVERNGELVQDRAWKGKQAKRLVKLLATREGKALSRDVLIDAIWPDGDPERYAPVLSNLLHRVRKTFDQGSTSGLQNSCIRFDAEQMSLDRAFVWTDVEAFRSAAEEAFRSKTAKTGRRSLQLYDQALAFYRGDLLPDDAYEDWTVQLRDSLRATYLKLLEQAGDIADGIEDIRAATAYHERLFDADQCNERACRSLMTKAIADGRRSDAVRTYERCQLALRRELDIEPDERTRRLYRSIIGG